MQVLTQDDERTLMNTYFELSKAAQEQVLTTIKQGQELALAGVELWTSNIPKGGPQAPVAFDTPAAKDVVANSFGFAEQILASQKAFAEKIVAVAAPVLAEATPKSK